jgi:hypothetical protein
VAASDDDSIRERRDTRISPKVRLCVRLKC